MIARVNSGLPPVGITGIGAHLPQRVVTNDDLAQLVDTTVEWIAERTGIRERRVAEPDDATSDIAVPAAVEALEHAGVKPGQVGLLIVSTASPDMIFPASASLVAEKIGAFSAAAFDLSAACTGFVYALAQAYGSVAGELVDYALVIGSEAITKLINWEDRATCVLFGDGAGAVVLERTENPGFLGFELGSDGSGGPELCVPGGGTRAPATAQTVEQGLHYLQMNGPEVYKFATRVLVTSAERILDICGLSVDDVDLYVPHQANKRIIDHAVRRLSFAEEKVFINLDRYGNTATASIPICLYEALETGALATGKTVLMTGVGGGLSWGSALVTWNGNE